VLKKKKILHVILHCNGACRIINDIKKKTPKRSTLQKCTPVSIVSRTNCLIMKEETEPVTAIIKGGYLFRLQSSLRQAVHVGSIEGNYIGYL
jgi:hypothetical protein